MAGRGPRRRLAGPLSGGDGLRAGRTMGPSRRREVHRKTRVWETWGGPSSIYLRAGHCKCVSKDPRAGGGPIARNDLRKQPSGLTLGWGSVRPHWADRNLRVWRPLGR